MFGGLATRKLVSVFAIAGGVVALQGGFAVAATDVSVEAFCRASLAWDTGDPHAPDRARATAPDQIADTVDFVVTKVREAGQAAAEDPAFLSARAEVDQFVLDACGHTTVDVTMADYRFEGIPARLTKGVVAFNLRNEGVELHDFHVVRFKVGGLTFDDLFPTTALGPKLGKSEQAAPLPSIEEVPGGGFAFPGGSDVALIEFKKPGKYVAFCTIAVGATPDATGRAVDEHAADASRYVPHYDEGMSVPFKVTK